MLFFNSIRFMRKQFLFNMLILMFAFLSFLQGESLPKLLFLSVGTFVDLPKLIPNTFGIFHENMFFEVSGVILASFWGRGRTLGPFGRPWGPGW